MKRILSIAAAVLLAAAILVSCEPGPAGLFALLEEEEPLDKGTAAFNANTAAFVARAGAYYYAAVGATLLRRDVAGGAWETVVVPGAPAGSVITDGVVSGAGVLYISFAPAKRTIYTYNGTIWTSNFQQASLPDAPIQSLLFDGTNLYAATSTSEDELTKYTLSYSTGLAFTPIALITDKVCGKPSSVAVGLGAIWIAAGNTIFSGGSPAGLDVYAHVPAGVSDENPVLDVTFDPAAPGYIIAAGTGSLYSLTGAASTASGTFGSSERRLSSVIVVPKNGGGNATVVGVKSWASDKYTGYYEYDAADNSTFGTVVPSGSYNMVSDDSNYVTTLDDLSIEGFYYDDTLGEETIFARTVMGGLWSNTWDGVSWSGWDRE